MNIEFSILVVCLNPGEKLQKTLQSIREQTYRNYEIIVKDGCSTDGSVDFVKEELRILTEESIKTDGSPSLRLIEKKDAGIYDAMNQAVLESEGRYLYFLNCGDVFYHENVLLDIHKLIGENSSETGIYYGNIFERRTGQMVASNPRMDAFGCYRNVPCHQACFYDRKLLLAHPFETKYRVRADYEQFLWCFFTEEIQDGVSFVYGDIPVVDYEGGGFSETRTNKKVSASEHREIVRKYMSSGRVWKYRILMLLTLAPFRTWIAGNSLTSGIYNRLKKIYYGKGVKS